MKMNSNTLLLALLCAGSAAASSFEVPSLTPDNFDDMTEGKTVFIKFFAPWVSSVAVLGPPYGNCTCGLPHGTGNAALHVCPAFGLGFLRVACWPLGEMESVSNEWIPICFKMLAGLCYRSLDQAVAR